MTKEIPVQSMTITSKITEDTTLLNDVFQLLRVSQ